MPRIGDPYASDLVKRWRERRREILRTFLPPEQLVEYRKIGFLIRGVKVEMSPQERQEAQVAEFATGENLGSKRVALSLRRRRLIKFLSEHGPATRMQMIKGARIPMGSLSEVLRGEEFENHERGLWRLKEQAEEPDTSEPPDPE